MFGLGEIFTLFFVTLGPLKVLGPFAKRTHGLDDATVRKIAVLAFVIATVAVVIGAFVGPLLMSNWNVSLAAMTLAGGVIFFLVAIKQLLEQYEPHEHVAVPVPKSPFSAAVQMVFPVVLTPYGIAAVIALVAASHQAQRTEMIVALLVGVMVLNLIAMLCARRVMVGMWLVVLQLLGAVLAVLQVALSVQVMIIGLQGLAVIAK